MTKLRDVVRAGAIGILMIAHAVPLRALDWTAKDFQGTAAPLQTTLDVAFSFRNNGDKRVTIRSIQTNCDCLAAQADKASYAPGEAGLVTARFSVGDRYGLYQRVITVVTDDGPPQRLSVAIEVPEPAAAEPRELVWSIGAAVNEQSADFRVAEGVNIAFSEAFATNESFLVRLEIVEPARHYRVHVSPRTTAVVANAAIRLVGRSSDDREIVVSAYANVR